MSIKQNFRHCMEFLQFRGRFALCDEAGADSYCTKPNRYGEMVEVVRDLVAKYLFRES